MNVINYLLEKAPGLDKDFVVGTNETITYKELDNKVNCLAAYIHNEFGAGKQLMLLSENNLFFIICYLAIIKSGNIVVLVETTISDMHLKTILNKCLFSGIFIQDKFKAKIGKNYKLFTESVLKELSEKDYEPKIITNDSDLAVIIFTSGSTGDKKGVMLTHKNIRVNTESIIEYMEITENDRIEVVLPFYYCFGTSLLHTHLRVGGSIVINKSIFLGSVIKEIDQYHCTGFAGVPATYQILISKTGFLKQEFPSIRYLAQAGGKLANKFILMIADAFPTKSFFIMYGATEATARLSYLPPHLIKEKLGSIGKGIPGVTLEVIDNNGNPIKPGEVGEITARGGNIMRGYYKDQEGTKKVLKNGRYCTGDLATIDKDGFIYVVGRSKNIIKSAGYRISPDEIEEAIVRVDNISNSVVIGVPDDIMGEAVVAVVETKKPSEKLKYEIISVCNSGLASYKVPQNVVFVNNFPLNSSRKVDVPKLKELAIEKIDTEGIEKDILMI